LSLDINSNRFYRKKLARNGSGVERFLVPSRFGTAPSAGDFACVIVSGTLCYVNNKYILIEVYGIRLQAAI